MRAAEPGQLLEQHASDAPAAPAALDVHRDVGDEAIGLTRIEHVETRPAYWAALTRWAVRGRRAGSFCCSGANELDRGWPERGAEPAPPPRTTHRRVPRRSLDGGHPCSRATGG